MATKYKHYVERIRELEAQVQNAQHGQNETIEYLINTAATLLAAAKSLVEMSGKTE